MSTRMKECGTCGHDHPSIAPCGVESCECADQQEFEHLDGGACCECGEAHECRDCPVFLGEAGKEEVR